MNRAPSEVTLLMCTIAGYCLCVLSRATVLNVSTCCLFFMIGRTPFSAFHLKAKGKQQR